jgi:hypothetical protein
LWLDAQARRRYEWRVAGAADLQIGSEFAGHRIDAVAGRGGMGVVYRATDLLLERTVALKLIAGDMAQDQGFRERFKRESKLAASIRHPNVITIYRTGEEAGLLYITMDFIEGTDFREMLAQRGRLEPRLAATHIAQVAAALDAAHGRGLVHRDVKPANVLIARDGAADPHVYLTDFGLAKQVSSASGVTATGMIVGTLDYIAPEQLLGGPLDARADIYALGCLTYQTITGRVPYPRDTQPAKMWAHMNEPPPSVLDAAPDVPARFDDIVRRAMAKDPNDRYPSAGDLGRAVLAAAAGQGSTPAERTVAVGNAAAGPTEVAQGQSASTVAAEPARAGRRSRVPLIAGVAALALALVVAAVLVLAGGDDGNENEPVSKTGQSGSPSAAAPAEQEIRRVVEEFSTSSDPEVCDLGTQAFHEQVWGGSGTNAIAACRTQLPKIKRSGQVSIRSLELSGNSASAEVTFGDGEEGEYTLIETQDGWRLNGYVVTKAGSNTGS